MPRPPLEKLSGSTALQPVAQPVDTYVQPRPSKGLADIIEALSGIAPELQKLGQGEMKKEHDDAYRAALISKAETLKEAIDAGEVTFGSSDIAQSAWQAGKGRNFGDSYFASTWDDFTKSDLYGSGDGRAVQAWLNERRGAALAGKSKAFTDSALSRMEGAENQIQQQATAEFHQRVEEETKSDLGAWMMDRAITGLAGGAAPEAIITELHSGTAMPRFAGLSGKDINRIEVQAMIAAAEKTANTKFLDLALLDRPDITNATKIVKGPGTIPEFAAELNAARNRVQSSQYTHESRAVLAQDKADKRGAGDAMRAVVNDALAHRGEPNYKTPPTLIAAGMRFDPDFGVKAQQAVNVFLSADQRENPTGLFQARERIRAAQESGQDPYAVLGDAINEGLVRDPISASKLYNDIESTDERDSPSSVFRMSGVKDVQSRMLRTLADKGQYGITGVLSRVGDERRTEIINDSALSFRAALSDWQKAFFAEHKRAPTPIEAQAQANALSEKTIAEAKAAAHPGQAHLEGAAPPSTAPVMQATPTNPIVRDGQPVPGTNQPAWKYVQMEVPTLDAQGRQHVVVRSFRVTPSADEIKNLQKNPGVAATFDRHYGAGVATFFLGMTQQQITDYLSVTRLPEGAKPKK